MNQRPSRIVAMAAAAALGLALLTGCPAEDKKETGTADASPGSTTTTTTTTTTTSAAPDAAASTDAMAASPAASAAAATTTTAAAGDAAQGKTIFANRCQACHGANGSGGMGPKLADVDKKGDAYIKNTVLKGHPDKGMPSFEGQLQPAEIDAVVAYVKAL
jgi:mono/diheme cytochrome c family protein